MNLGWSSRRDRRFYLNIYEYNNKNKHFNKTKRLACNWRMLHLSTYNWEVIKSLSSSRASLRDGKDLLSAIVCMSIDCIEVFPHSFIPTDGHIPKTASIQSLLRRVIAKPASLTSGMYLPNFCLSAMAVPSHSAYTIMLSLFLSL